MEQSGQPTTGLAAALPAAVAKPTAKACPGTQAPSVSAVMLLLLRHVRTLDPSPCRSSIWLPLRQPSEFVDSVPTHATIRPQTVSTATHWLGPICQGKATGYPTLRGDCGKLEGVLVCCGSAPCDAMCGRAAVKLAR